MTSINDNETLEATAEQLAMLRDLGAQESELDDLSFADAEEWISELLAKRQAAGRYARE